MVKRIITYSLPKGTDPDEFWKFHTGVHASDFKKIAGPGLKKYVINRVREVKTGEKMFFGLIELWYETEQAMMEAMNRAETIKTMGGNAIAEDFWSRITGGFAALVEEVQIVP